LAVIETATLHNSTLRHHPNSQARFTAINTSLVRVFKQHIQELVQIRLVYRFKSQSSSESLLTTNDT